MRRADVDRLRRYEVRTAPLPPRWAGPAAVAASVAVTALAFVVALVVFAVVAALLVVGGVVWWLAWALVLRR